ncbi:MAG TPA: DinB family protein [Pyrinomonadaceae bacterium]|nr:DinB family protein [Pyrinomonadaceae bacterium]
MNMQKELRRHLLELLEGKSAHIDLKTVLNEFPLDEINTRLGHAPHTAWELLEHLRIAQHDIVEFSRDANHVSPKFPDGYWNKKDATAEDWQTSSRQILKDLLAMRELIIDEKTDLLAPIPHGNGQTVLREALLVADHNTYHLGQIAFLMRTLERK